MEKKSDSSGVYIFNEFEFERLLKVIAPFIAENDLVKLKNWKSKERAYQSAWEGFETFSHTKTALRVKLRAEQLVELENEVNDTVSIVFLETPDPSSANGNWDGGKEKETIKSREKAIIEISKYINQTYESLWENQDKIQLFINDNIEDANEIKHECIVDIDMNVDEDKSTKKMANIDEDTIANVLDKTSETIITTENNIQTENNISKLIYHDDDMI